MDRRKFIESGAVVLAAAAAADRSLASTPVFGGPPVKSAARFAVGYHNGLANGYWVDAMARPYETLPAVVNVFLLGLQAAASPVGANPLVRFNLDLLYKTGGATTAPYRYATLTRNGALATSKPITHRLSANQVSGLAVSLDYRDTGGKVANEKQMLQLTSLSLPRLTTGFYVVVGPQTSTGLPPSWGLLADPVSRGCLVSRCDNRSNDFDAILIAVEPVG